MHCKKLSLVFAAFGAAVMLTSAAQAAPVIFFGENQSPSGMVSGAPVTARTDFLAGLSGVGSQGFERFSAGAAAPLNIDFPGSSGALTATLGLQGQVQTPGSGGGRFNTTGGGSNWWEVSGTFDIQFSDPVSAFGFYGTDVGDFNGQITLTLTDMVGGITNLKVPNTVNGSDGSLLFFGFIDTTNSYKSIQFGNTSGGGDFFGFDDMVIGDREQLVPAAVAASVPVPEPATLALVGLSLLGLAGTRRRR